MSPYQKTVKTGQVVQYRLTAGDVAVVGARHIAGHCNIPKVGDIVGAMVVRTWPGRFCNLQVFVDGDFTIWKESVQEGGDEGEFTT